MEDPPGTTSQQTGSQHFSVELSSKDLSSDEFRHLFEKVKEAVLTKKPILREILQKRGDKKLYEYAKEYIDVNLNPPIQSRQDELLYVLGGEVERLLGTDIAKSVVKQLERYYFVSTADHHGPLTHPFFVNSNLIITAPFSEYDENTLHNVIVLACANCSLNNSSFPRGIVFHSKIGDIVHYHGLSFFPAQSRLCPVFKFRPYGAADLKRVREGITTKVKEGTLAQNDADAVSGILKDVYDRPEILSSETYSDQVTKTNHLLWKKFFERSSPQPASNLVYLEIESIVAKLLVKYHLTEDTIINHFLFDPEYENPIIQHFEGIIGTFSLTEKWGSYLFWALPEGKKYREQLWKEGNFLVTEDKKYRVELTPEALKKAIEAREIIPSTMLNYITLSFYYGLKCLGGFSQVNYLTFMKNAYIKMQADRGNYRSIEVCARAQTKELVGDVNAAFLRTPRGELLPATGIDLILYGHKDSWSSFIKQSKTITVEEALNPMMPELYKIIYSEGERDSELLALTAEDITRHTQLREKIEACIAFPS